MAVLRNSPPLVAALAAIQTISLNGNNMAADSFDSADANYSDPGGLYPVNVNKTKANGDVAAGYGIIDSLGVGNLIVKGSVRTGSGTNTVYIGANGSVGDRAWVEGGNHGIQTGHYADDMNVVWDQVVLPPANPTWMPVSGGLGVVANYMTNGITYDYYFTQGGDYQVYGGYLTRGVLIAPNVNVRLWIYTGDVKIPGVGEIRIPANASLKIYMGGALFSISGGGVVNEGGYAVNFQYYGLPTNTRIEFQGNGDFTGWIYAPNADFYLGGGGSGMFDFIGSSITKSVSMNGHFKFHYDENLQRIGLSVGGVLPTPGTVRAFRLRK